MRIVRLENIGDAREVMRDIEVDPYGIRLMAPKALMYAVRLDAITPVSANILKQEMLSLGGDAAIARHALSDRRKKTDCLILGTLAQLEQLAVKLRRQPFGLSALGEEIRSGIDRYGRNEFTLDFGGRVLRLGVRTRIMGIVNVTPDSFSGDGLHRPQAKGRRPKVDLGEIVSHVEGMVEDGADIIDIGGESSRPGAKPVSLTEEIARVVPVIKACAKKIRTPISVDTVKPEVARRALDAGASIVNDIAGLRDKRMRSVVASHKAHVVIMHMLGVPRTMQKEPSYSSVTGDIIDYLRRHMALAVDAGVPAGRIILDPGIGFGKTQWHNLQILKHLAEFKILGRPLLVGTSRKSFIGAILDADPAQRLQGTVASCVVAAINGAHIVRVHDVKAVREALAVCSAVRESHN